MISMVPHPSAVARITLAGDMLPGGIAIARNRNVAQKHVARAKVILATAEGCGTMEVMRRSGLSKPGV